MKIILKQSAKLLLHFCILEQTFLQHPGAALSHIMMGTQSLSIDDGQLSSLA